MSADEVEAATTRLAALEAEAAVLRTSLVQARRADVQTAARTSPFREDTDIQQHFENVTRGPGSMKWRHYFDIYHKHMARFRNTDVHVMEIGVFAGGGLRMWRWFFGKKARLFGVDFANGTRVYERHLNYGRPDRMIIGDQENPQFWSRFKRKVRRIDVILDDGGHEPEQQQMTLTALLPHLSYGGVYICEDVHETNRFARHVFMDYVYYGSRGLNGYDNYRKIDNVSTLGIIQEPTIVQQEIAEVSFYPFMVVLEKTPSRRMEMLGYRRGDLWRRFGLANGKTFAFPGTCERESDCPVI